VYALVVNRRRGAADPVGSLLGELDRDVETAAVDDNQQRRRDLAVTRI
jgi:hypothetical protein